MKWLISNLMKRSHVDSLKEVSQTGQDNAEWPISTMASGVWLKAIIQTHQPIPLWKRTSWTRTSMSLVHSINSLTHLSSIMLNLKKQQTQLGIIWKRKRNSKQTQCHLIHQTVNFYQHNHWNQGPYCHNLQQHCCHPGALDNHLSSASSGWRTWVTKKDSNQFSHHFRENTYLW